MVSVTVALTKEEIGKQLLAALPPSLENIEGTIEDLKTLKAFSDSLMEEYDRTICKVPSLEGSSQVEILKRKLENYQKLYTEKNLSPRFSCIEKDGKIEIQTYVQKVEASNCITGSWRAKWTVKILTEKTADLTGEVTFHSHYYERGANVQTRSIRDFPSEEVATEEEKVNSMVHKFEKEKMSYEEQLSVVIVTAIAERERKLFDDLQMMFNDYSADLRKVRRILPITKTRFKWDSAAQKNVKLLNERKTE